MSQTWSANYDNLSLHAMKVPSGFPSFSKITMREQAQDSAPVSYDVAAPKSSSTTLRRYQGEPSSFVPGPGGRWIAGSTFGYVQPVTGTITFDFIGED